MIQDRICSISSGSSACEGGIRAPNLGLSLAILSNRNEESGSPGTTRIKPGASVDLTFTSFSNVAAPRLRPPQESRSRRGTLQSYSPAEIPVARSGKAVEKENTRTRVPPHHRAASQARLTPKADSEPLRTIADASTLGSSAPSASALRPSCQGTYSSPRTPSEGRIGRPVIAARWV